MRIPRFRVLLLQKTIVALFLSAAAPAEAQVQGRVEGTVRDATTHAPIDTATVRVSVDGISPIGVQVDADGTFQVGLPAGERVFLVQAPGYRTVRNRVTVEAASRVTVEIEMQPCPQAGCHSTKPPRRSASGRLCTSGRT
jgi:hypothetical protein